MARIHSQEIIVRVYKVIPDATDPEEEGPPDSVLSSEENVRIERVIRESVGAETFVEIVRRGPTRSKIGSSGSTLV